MTVQNPIIPGFFPDPSCIKVGSSFYLVNSSFQFFPGIPIHESIDLVNWKHIGNAICRPSQLDLGQATTRNTPSRNEIFTGGLFAPTIRFRKGIFYIFCTDLYLRPQDAPDGDYFPQNFYVTSTDLRDPNSFSDPILYDFYGIDPSIYFDEDDQGRAYVQGSFMNGYDQPVQATTIKQVEIDIKTGKSLGPMKEIWEGFSGIIPEGPHIYRKDGYYYLLVAEGGTFEGHMLTMARSQGSIWGPYEPCPHNPIIKENDEVCPLIQRVGHGELVYDDTTQSWWATVLAARSGAGRTSFPLGRETFLTGVDWPPGEWPTLVPVQEAFEARRPLGELSHPKMRKHLVSLNDTKTLYLRTPVLDDYREENKTFLLTPSINELSVVEGTTTFVGQRQYTLAGNSSVVLQLPDRSANSGGTLHAGLAVYKDTNRHFSVFVDITSNGNMALVFEVEKIGDFSNGPQRMESVSLPSTLHEVTLSMQSSLDKYEFFYTTGQEQKKIGEAEGKHLSGNDFTGAVYAIFASGTWKESVAFNNFTLEY